MPTPEQQKILNQINNRQTERAGWIGFAIGTLVTTILFLVLFIPIAQQEARIECISSGNCTFDR